MLSLAFSLILWILIIVFYYRKYHRRCDPTYLALCAIDGVITGLLIIIASAFVEYEDQVTLYSVMPINNTYAVRDNGFYYLSYLKDDGVYNVSLPAHSIIFSDTITQPVYTITKHIAKPNWFNKHFGCSRLYNIQDTKQFMYPVKR